MLLAAVTGWDLLVAVSVFFTVCAVLVAIVAVFAIRKAELEEDDPYIWRISVGRPVECVCGRELAGGTLEHHLVTESFTDDAHLAGAAIGSTGASADFCPDHCPGGCNQGCPVLKVVT